MAAAYSRVSPRLPGQVGDGTDEFSLEAAVNPQLAKLYSQIQAGKHAYDALFASSQKCSADLEELKGKHLKLSSENQSLVTDLQKVKMELDAKSQDVERAKKSLESQLDANAILVKDNPAKAEFERKIKDISERHIAEMAKRRGSVSQTEGKLAQAISAKDYLQREFTESRNEVERLKSTIAILEKKLDDINLENSAMKRQISLYESLIGRIQKENEQLTDENEALKLELKKCKCSCVLL